MMIGTVRLRAQDPADLDAGELGQHQVQQDEVRLVGAEPGQRLAAVGGRDDPVSLGSSASASVSRRVVSSSTTRMVRAMRVRRIGLRLTAR